MDTKLWKYNKTTGYWNLVRTCAAETAQKWLDIFSTDEPRELFKLSLRKPAAPKI